jgi:hypothetical protein
MDFSRNMISAFALAAFGCMLTGCAKQGETPGSAIAEGSRILTVDEYLKQPELRKKMFASCANDPGRKGSDANCVNALQAERIASAGAGRFPGAKP